MHVLYFIQITYIIFFSYLSLALCYLQIQEFDGIPNAEDPDGVVKQRHRHNNVELAAERLSFGRVNHTTAAPSHEVSISICIFFVVFSSLSGVSLKLRTPGDSAMCFTFIFLCIRMGSVILMIWRVHFLHFLLNLFRHLSEILSFSYIFCYLVLAFLVLICQHFI